jgi:HPt (histidine-containing phosphotransfer) domain-containing protein
MKAVGGSVERSLLTLSVGAASVLALSLIAFAWVERQLSANIDLNNRVVVPARQLASALDSAMEALSSRQERIERAKSLEMVTAAAPRDAIVDVIRATELRLVHIAKELRGQTHLPADIEAQFAASFERYLDSDEAFLHAAERRQVAIAQLEVAALTMEKRLRGFVQQARSIAGRMRYQEGSSARRLSAALARGGWTPELSRQSRDLLSPSSRLRASILVQVVVLADELHRLATRLALATSDTQLRSLWSNQLVPARDRLQNALEDLIEESRSDADLARAARALQQEAVSIAGLLSATELTNSLVARAQAAIDAGAACERVQGELGEASKQPAALTQQLVRAAETQGSTLSRRLNGAASVARWLQVGMLAVCIVGGVVGIRKLRGNIAELRATNVDLLRLKDQLTELNQGLERKVEERTQALDRQNRAMRLVLDNVDQGFVTIDRQGAIVGERSARFDTWLGVPAGEANLGQHLAGKDRDVGEFLQEGWRQVESGTFPAEVALELLPKRARVDGRTMELRYKVIASDADEIPARSLVIMTDITEQLERARAEAAQRECATLLGHFLADRGAFAQFLRESDRLIDLLRSQAGSFGDLFRAVHTLKGNAGMFGLNRLAERCHQLESRMMGDQGPPPEKDSEEIALLWAESTRAVRALIPERSSDRVEIDAGELERVLTQARALHAPREVIDTISRWRHEPVLYRLEQLAQAVDRLARRLDKQVEAVVSDGGVRLPAERLAPFWCALVHVVRNAIDHGIETPRTRMAAGKSPRGRIELRAGRTDAGFEITVSDDGAGIDWKGLAEKAAVRGLPYANQDELIEALFQDGVSTAEEVTELSGRGVGMGAVRATVFQLAGRVHVSSTPATGTEWVFRFPASVLDEGQGTDVAAPRGPAA